MSNSLLFFLSAADQARIVPGSINVTDEYDNDTPALKIQFTIADPQHGAPQIRLLWPGRIDFRPDPQGSGTKPAPQDVDFTQSTYDSWPTVGTLRLKADSTRATAIKAAAGDLEVVPNCIWYFPVKLSLSFLFNTIGNSLGKHIIDFYSDKIDRTSGQYAKNAISWFLSEKYGPLVNSYQRTELEMPTVEMSSTGAVTLYLTTAEVRGQFQDGPRTALVASAGNLSESDPAHPINGWVPPRRVMQKMTASLQNIRGANNVLLPLPQKILEPPADSAPLIFIRFRRTWKKSPNYSHYFPTQQVQIFNALTDEMLFSGRIPQHGVVYCKIPTASTGGNIPIRLKILGGMRCLQGDDDSQPLWRDKATASELIYNFSAAGPFPQVILRQPMAEEIFLEENTYADAAACSYYSMSRALRALVNNRIAGGQLLYQSLSVQDLKKLLRTALSSVATEAIMQVGPSKGVSGETREERDNYVAELANSLVPVWEQFFPGKGFKAYTLWQSFAAQWYEDDRITLKPSYNDITDLRGRGAPAALVYVGLASALHNDPRLKLANEDKDQYAAEMTLAVLEGLKPGAILQFWKNYIGYEILKKRRATEAEKSLKDTNNKSIYFVGHSPIFKRYLVENGTVNGLHVLDQNKKTGVDVRRSNEETMNGRLRYGSYAPDLWIAANWDE